MNRLKVYEQYEKGEFIAEWSILYLTNYILANVVSNFSPNRSFWYEKYTNETRLYIVCRWRKKNGFVPCLFDICCLSISRNDSFEKLSETISEYMSAKYKKMKGSGCCLCLD